MAVHNSFNSAFKAMYKKLGQVEKTLPKVLGNEGTNFFLSNFDKEGFQDDGLKKWKEPQRKIVGTKAYKYPKKKDLGRRTRKTLVKTGKLKRAVNASRKETNYKRIVWRIPSTVVPYAARHNYGLDGMPKRHFIGESRTLNKIFKKRIIEAYKKGLNG